MEKKRYDELDITDPFIFSKVMGDKKLCREFLERVLNIKIRDIKYLEYEETIQLAPNSKGVRLDVYVEDDKNTVFNLEMQTTNYKELSQRARYYQDVIDINLIEKGDDYDILKESYVVFICTFDFFKENKCVYEFENLCVSNPQIKLNDGTHKIFLNTKGDKSDINDELKALLNYFDGERPSSRYTKELEKKVIEVRENEQWRREYMSWQRDMNQQYKNGLKQGREEGRSEGREEVNKLILKLLSEGKEEELKRVVADEEYQKELMKKYSIIE